MKDFVIRRIGKSEIYYLVEVNSEFFLNIPRWWLRYRSQREVIHYSQNRPGDQHCWYSNTPVIMISDGYCLTMFLSSVSNVLSHADIYISHLYAILSSCDPERWVVCILSKKLLWDDCPEHWHHSGDSGNQRFPSCISQTCHSGATVDVGMIREYYYTRIN